MHCMEVNLIFFFQSEAVPVLGNMQNKRVNGGIRLSQVQTYYCSIWIGWILLGCYVPLLLFTLLLSLSEEKSSASRIQNSASTVLKIRNNHFSDVMILLTHHHQRCWLLSQPNEFGIVILSEVPCESWTSPNIIRRCCSGAALEYFS